MKDLQLKFLTSYGALRQVSYDTIMDFTNDFETRRIDTQGTMVTAIFFEKACRTKIFNSMHELYEFCIEIMK